MANLCIIPARGGSKRIPNKNILEFHGKPIICWSVEAALESKLFDRVIVSTDSEEIAEVAKSAGADIPFLRPAELSDDYADTMSVIQHGIAEVSDASFQPEFVCCLYATAPFATSQVLQDGFELLKANPGKKFCFPVTSFPFPILRGVELQDDDSVSMIWPENEKVRSQDLVEAFHDAGQFYWGKSEAFLNEVRLFAPHSLGLKIPRYQVQDIDTPEDWKIAELMFKAQQERETESK